MLEFPCLKNYQSLILNTLSPKQVNTDIRSVRRRRIVFVVLSDLMEVILVQLTDETCKVAVLEVFGQNGLGELLVLRRRQYALERYTCSRFIPQEPRNSRLPLPI